MKFLIKYLFLAFLMIFACQPGKRQVQVKQKEITKYQPIVNFDLAKIKQRGKLIAITDYNTTSYFVYKGQPMGYQYEMLKRLANHIGVKLELIVNSDINESIQMLNEGKCDILAQNLFANGKGAELVAFTEHYTWARQVLVQRKPQGWRKMSISNINKLLVKSPSGLLEKDIYIRRGSFYDGRLQQLAHETGRQVSIREASSDSNTEDLIKEVVNAEIDYTIADEHIARVFGNYYSNLDVSTPVSSRQKIAWAVRKNSPKFLEVVNAWLKKLKRTNEYYAINDKYFKSSKAYRKRVTSPYFSLNNRLSPYDDLIKKSADRLGWDWRLLASLVYQESKFNPLAQSYAGAVGLMQLMPATGRRFGVNNFMVAGQSMKAGTTYLLYLDKFWKKKIPNREERIKFVLASYNVGQGHVLDAYKLAGKYAKDESAWEENVAHFLLQKSTPKYYRDPIVKLGYCRGREPVRYVREVFHRYEHYKNLIKG